MDLKLYGSAATVLSQMGEVLRKFNIDVELSNTIGIPYRLTEQPSAKNMTSIQDATLNSNLTASNDLKSVAKDKLVDIDHLNDFDSGSAKRKSLN